MKTKICKWGNSLAVRIPNVLATQVAFSEGSEIEMSAEQNRLVIQPKKSFNLIDMLEGVTPENLHQEIDTGSARGKEVW